MITKIYFTLIGVGQAVFLYEILSVFTHRVIFPQSTLNYVIGYATLAVLIVDIFVTLKDFSRYLAFLTVIPVINIIIVGIIAYKLTRTVWMSFLTSLVWFSNLLLTLLFPTPAILAYNLDLSLVGYMSLQDLSSLSSLILMGFLIMKYEKDLINGRRV